MAESVKNGLQQLETSMNAVAIETPSRYRDENQTVAFIGCWFKQSLFTFMKIWTIKIIV